MIDRRKIILTAACSCSAFPLTSLAQQTSKLRSVGILTPGPANGPSTEPNLAAFQERLRALGWLEGKNILLERRGADGHAERYPALAAELVNARVEVILAAGGPTSLQAARNATKSIPIVMVASSRDPVGEGLINSFARPGGNITGVATSPSEGIDKLLELLKESVPSISRVGVIWDATVRPYRLSQETDHAARSLGIELVGFEVREPADFDRSVGNATKVPVGGLVIASTPLTTRYAKEMADTVNAHRLPSIALFRRQAEAGLLMTYGPSLTEAFRGAATFVDRILKGRNPGEIPVEQPTTFELVINLRAAQALGITMPQSILIRADEVIR